MNKKIAKAFEWVGVAIILSGVGFFAFIKFKHIVINSFHHSILLFVLGFGILCYVPLNFVKYSEKSAEASNAEENNLPDSTNARKIATSLKRSIALKIICAVVLIGYGVLKYLGIK